MSAPTALIPGKPVPELSLELASGAPWKLSDSKGKNFSLLTFYRGYHCPKCKEQLSELQGNLLMFENRGVAVTAISMDPQERTDLTVREWGIDRLQLARGLTVEGARQWGLHLSSSRGMTSIGVEELKIFNEPGLFLIRPDGELYASWVQTVPFARPRTSELLAAIDFVLDKNYPPRGTLEAA